MALASALLFARADRGLMTHVMGSTAAGFLARRLYPAVIGIPLVLGGLTLAAEQYRWFNGKFGLTLMVLLSVVLFVALVAVTNRSFERAEAARARLAAVLLGEAERRHLARELHDEIGQSLTALKARLEMKDQESALRLVGDVMRQVSNLSLDLRPAMLDDLGLVPALVWLTERFGREAGLEIDFRHDGVERRFSREIETAAFRIAQEALTNAARHAGAPRAQVRLFAQDQRLCVQVEDEGKGFTVEPSPSSSGLLGMRERAEAVGGRLEIESAPGRGTRVLAELPISEA
jgi:signal transduction histidine kinase